MNSSDSDSGKSGDDVISSTEMTPGTSDHVGAAEAEITVPAESSIHSSDPDSRKSEEDVVCSPEIPSGTSNDAGAAKTVVTEVRSNINTFNNEDCMLSNEIARLNRILCFETLRSEYIFKDSKLEAFCREDN